LAFLAAGPTGSLCCYQRQAPWCCLMEGQVGGSCMPGDYGRATRSHQYCSWSPCRRWTPWFRRPIGTKRWCLYRVRLAVITLSYTRMTWWSSSHHCRKTFNASTASRCSLREPQAWSQMSTNVLPRWYAALRAWFTLWSKSSRVSWHPFLASILVSLYHSVCRLWRVDEQVLVDAVAARILTWKFGLLTHAGGCCWQRSRCLQFQYIWA
jgi:hypothetical protein